MADSPDDVNRARGSSLVAEGLSQISCLFFNERNVLLSSNDENPGILHMMELFTLHER